MNDAGPVSQREIQLRQALALPGLNEGQRAAIRDELQALRETNRRREDAAKPTEARRNLEAINKDRAANGLPPYRQDEWDLMKAREARTQVNIDQKGETKFQETTGKAIAERIDGIAKDGDQAMTDKALVGQLRDLGSQIQTGGWAATTARLAELGIKLPGASQIEAYGALIDRLTPQQRVPGSGATSDFDAKMFKGSLPRLINTPEGNRIIIETMDALADNRMKRAEIAGLIQNGDLDRKEGFRQINEIQKQAKQLSDRVMEAARKGPAAVQTPQGQTQAANPSAQPQQATQPVQDGMTATNPQTGQKIRLQGGQWVPVQ